MKLAQRAAEQQQGLIGCWMRRFAVSLLLLLSIGLGCAADALAQTATADNNSAPDFALRAVSGENLRLSEYRGQVVALGFWARWCGDCRQAMKALNEIYAKYQRAGLVMLGIDVDDTLEQTSTMTRSLGLSFPVLVDEHKTASSLFNVKSMPLIVLIDREGRQRYRHTSFELGDEARIGAELRTLLNE
jgi:peroxiredoxin